MTVEKEEITSLERLRKRVVKDMMALENDIMNSMGKLIDEVGTSGVGNLRAHDGISERDLHLKVNNLYAYARLIREVEEFWVYEHNAMMVYDS